MLKSWMTFSKSVPTSSPALRAAAVTSNSLPKSQTPTFLPAKSAGLVMFESFHDTDFVPERWKICAMFTRSDGGVPSLASRTFGTHEIVNSGPSVAEPATCGMMSGPAGTNVTLSPSSS